MPAASAMDEESSVVNAILEHDRTMNGSVGGVEAVVRKKPWLKRCFTQKPLEVVHAEENEGMLERTLGFWDLFALGFGGTIGSGVFVMTGLICHEIAGPAAFLSWFAAGVGCLLSALSFAELSWRVPSAGGAYAYTFVALGELPAVIVGWCMTLEYGVSAAAVAKSWGEMLKVGLHHAGGEDDTSSHQTVDGGGPEVDFEGLPPRGGSEGGGGGLHVFGGSLDMGGVYAALLQVACVAIVVGGLKTSTITVNTFSVAKALLVVFMVSTAFSLYEVDNLVPLAPFGVGGVLKGSVAAFFGFLGFDEIVLLSPEAKNPMKHIPRALFSSLLAVAFVCAAASISLSGASTASDLDPDSAFAEAFRQRGMTTAYHITAIGEVVTLPLVVLVSFMGQPRLLFAMAKDGLFPRMFAEVDSRGTLMKGALMSGAVCVVTAALVPFDALNNIISAGVLLAFNFVTSSHLVLRHRACTEDSPAHSHSGAMLPLDRAGDESSEAKVAIVRVLYANVAACISAGLVIVAESSQNEGAALAIVFSVLCGVTCLCVLLGLQAHPRQGKDIAGGNFMSPFFPWPQAAALWVNWFLVCNLPPSGIIALLAYVALATGHYVCFGAANSVGNCSGWASLLSEASTRTGSDGCLSRAMSHDAENVVAVGTPSCLYPSADAPLLGDSEGFGGDSVGEPSPAAAAAAAGREEPKIALPGDGIASNEVPRPSERTTRILRRRASDLSYGPQ